MKLIKQILTILILIFVMTGCASLSRESADKITSPQNKAVPLQGSWIIKDCYEEDAESKNMVDSGWIGKEFKFQGNSITFNGTYWENVNYKSKRVNADEYFMHKIIAANGIIDVKSDEIQVITASSEDKYLYEFVMLEDEQIIVSIDNQLYCMKKVSAGMEELYKGAKAENEKNKENERVTGYAGKTVETGLLLGIRIPQQIRQKGTEEMLEEYIYKTYWISMKEGMVGQVLAADDIYLPRKDGFWKLKVAKILGSEGIEDTLSAAMVSSGYMKKTDLEVPASEKLLRMETKLRKTILYVGNDFICTENVEEIRTPDSPQEELKKVLRTMTVDNITKMEGIKFSDLTGENGSLAITGAISEVLSSSNTNSISKINEEEQEQNFALFRKTGHWFFKGRITMATGEPLAFMDFNINLIPPADMVAYDILHIPWTIIKDRVPEAFDAYTSPNKDLALVLTRNSVLLYPIRNGDMDLEAANKLSIPEGSTVVMAEWATGDYVEYWEKSFLKNNQTETIE